jgi:hypothetical protein
LKNKEKQTKSLKKKNKKNLYSLKNNKKSTLPGKQNKQNPILSENITCKLHSPEKREKKKNTPTHTQNHHETNKIHRYIVGNYL